MNKITFLGPVGATFSHQAYAMLAKIYGAPKDDAHLLVPAHSNAEIVSMIIAHGGYGSIAMETRAEGRVAEPLESFIDLLSKYQDEQQCPIQIIGAYKMKLNFALMVRDGMSREQIKGIIAHPKALGACKQHIQAMNISTATSPSNGTAAQDVSSNPVYAEYGALGPISAAHKYGLTAIDHSFEDQEAITTFFLLGNKTYKIILGAEQRCLIVFKTHHVAGAIVDALIPFKQAGINLIQIHSVHAGNGTYGFAVETECPKSQVGALMESLKDFRKNVQQSIVLGPFPVVSS